MKRPGNPPEHAASDVLRSSYSKRYIVMLDFVIYYNDNYWIVRPWIDRFNVSGRVLTYSGLRRSSDSLALSINMYVYTKASPFAAARFAAKSA